MRPNVHCLGRLVFWALSALSTACSGLTDSPVGRYTLTFDDAYVIYEIDPVWHHQRIVLHDTLTSYDVTWSPDGRSVAYMRQFYPISGGVSYRLFVFDTEDSTERQLTFGPDDSGLPAWSPTGDYIAYLSTPSQGGGGTTLRLIRPDGTGDHRADSEFYYVRSPEWSPDGRYLAATRSDFIVVVVDPFSGSTIHEVAPGISPTWSPDGKRLAFVSGGLVIANLNGQNARVVLPLPAYEPAWSPDGRWIAFERVEAPPLDVAVFVIAANRTPYGAIRRMGVGRRPAWRSVPQ